jgi:hypothetical protein
MSDPLKTTTKRRILQLCPVPPGLQAERNAPSPQSPALLTVYAMALVDVEQRYASGEIAHRYRDILPVVLGDVARSGEAFTILDPSDRTLQAMIGTQ